MQATRKIGSDQYYDKLPTSQHSCGDIWTNLPSFELVGRGAISGIVVTPACDLMQVKTPTVTYLPIIPVRTLFSLPGFAPDIRRRLDGLLTASNSHASMQWPVRKYSLPDEVELSRVENILTAHGQTVIPMNQRSAVVSSIDGLNIIRKIVSPDIHQIPASQLLSFLGVSKYEEVKERIVGNGYSADLHFLPPDDQIGPFSGVPSPSVILFRYPLTLPIEILDVAQEITAGQWEAERKALISRYPVASACTSMPIKAVRLKSEFLADVLSRYTNMYNRLGSPDFSAATKAEHQRSIDS